MITHFFRDTNDNKSVACKQVTMPITLVSEGTFYHCYIQPKIFTDSELFIDLFNKILNHFKVNKIPFLPLVLMSSISKYDSELNNERLSRQNRQKRFLRNNPLCSFIFNSSAWVQYVEFDYNETIKDFNIKKTQKNYNEAIDYFKMLKSLNIYSNPNAKEYFNYHLRLQLQNYLDDFDGGHGNFITPNVYSDELLCLKAIKKINASKEIKYQKPEILHYNKATYNILLIDDKVEKGELIKNLLSHFKDEPNIFNNTVWDEGAIEHRFFKRKNEINSSEIETEKDYVKRIEDFANDKSFEGKTKIYQVTTVKDTIRLLSSFELNIRFGIILMDYLLDKEENEKREFSTAFFEWFTNNKKSDDDTYKLGCSDKELIRAIKDNRGPLQKLWIFPITAFNQTFIDNLRNNNIRLIDYYWHISRGADPINTPYLFLRSLNMFLYLQLQQAVYDLNTLIVFLKRTTKNIKKIKANDFQSYMGSEYTVIIQKHGWRPVISRDANAGSLFSKYIWSRFYSDDKNKYLFRLMDKMQKFFHVCTFADETDYDTMMLYWKELDIFITDYWNELIYEYADRIINAKGGFENEKRDVERKKIIEIEKIIKPDLSSFRIIINKYLDKNN